MADQHDVLIVDDVGSSRELLAGLLKQVCKLPFRMARNGQEALDAVANKAPAIVFLDIDLPDHSGLDVLRKVHAQNANVFVVMVSGVGTPHNVKVSRESGASAFILKPFKPQKVLEVLMAYERASHQSILIPQPA